MNAKTDSLRSDRQAVREYSPDLVTAEQYVAFKRRLAVTQSGISYPDSDKCCRSLLRPEYTETTENSENASRQRQFVAVPSGSSEDSRDWQAHVVARVSSTQTDDNDLPIGMLGFFESVNDSEAAKSCLHAAVGWLRIAGCQTIVGPIDGDTWHDYRFNVGPLEDSLFLGEPSNPDYYPQLWNESGFELLQSYHSKAVQPIRLILPYVEPSLEAAKSKGYRFRHIDLERFDAELDIIYDLSVASFTGNFLYEPITRDAFKQLYESARSVVDERLVWFAYDAHDVPVGFLFCIIDYRVAVDAMRGSRNWLSKLRFLMNKHKAKSVNFKSICVLPAHRQNSVAAALMCKGYQASIEKRFHRANLCLIKDGNPSTKLDGGAGRTIRRYNLYQFPESLPVE